MESKLWCWPEGSGWDGDGLEGRRGGYNALPEVEGWSPKLKFL